VESTAPPATSPSNRAASGRCTGQADRAGRAASRRPASCARVGAASMSNAGALRLPSPCGFGASGWRHGVGRQEPTPPHSRALERAPYFGLPTNAGGVSTDPRQTKRVGSRAGNATPGTPGGSLPTATPQQVGRRVTSAPPRAERFAPEVAPDLGSRNGVLIPRRNTPPGLASLRHLQDAIVGKERHDTIKIVRVECLAQLRQFRSNVHVLSAT
jgi:hypothetical protein